MNKKHKEANLNIQSLAGDDLEVCLDKDNDLCFETNYDVIFIPKRYVYSVWKFLDLEIKKRGIVE